MHNGISLQKDVQLWALGVIGSWGVNFQLDILDRMTEIRALRKLCRFVMAMFVCFLQPGIGRIPPMKDHSPPEKGLLSYKIRRYLLAVLSAAAGEPDWPDARSSRSSAVTDASEVLSSLAYRKNRWWMFASSSSPVWRMMR